MRTKSSFWHTLCIDTEKRGKYGKTRKSTP